MTIRRVMHGETYGAHGSCGALSAASRGRLPALEHAPRNARPDSHGGFPHSKIRARPRCGRAAIRLLWDSREEMAPCGGS